MNLVAMQGLIDHPGEYRGEGEITISGSNHIPPPHDQLGPLVEEMCQQVDAERQRGEVWLALWRLNWIHPFEDGNGRVARSIAHLLLSVNLKLPRMPGKRALPQRILEERIKYWRLLGEADAMWKRRRVINVTNLQQFLDKHLRAMIKEALAGGDTKA